MPLQQVLILKMRLLLRLQVYLAIMNREELEAVMGHEVSHIRNYDIRISTIAVALASAITMLSSMAGRMSGGVEQVADEVMMIEMEMVLKSLC